MPKQSARVEGIPEAQQAFEDVKRGLDKAALAEAAGQELLPSVRRYTRRDSGALLAGWDVEPSADAAMIVNAQDYMPYQEFGTEFIDPMHAVSQAWEHSEEDVLRAYDEGIKAVAEDAGFEQ